MRITPPALGLALALLTISSAVKSQRSADAIDARSLALVAQARGELGAGKLDQAEDSLETALVVDPRNRSAYALLADVARRQALPGKAIRLYRESLLIEPNDLAALAGQGEAMVQKGAVTKARDNLAKIKALCTGSCPEGALLTAAIAKGPPATVQSAQVATPAPASN